MYDVSTAGQFLKALFASFIGVDFTKQPQSTSFLLLLWASCFGLDFAVVFNRTWFFAVIVAGSKGIVALILLFMRRMNRKLFIPSESPFAFILAPTVWAFSTLLIATHSIYHYGFWNTWLPSLSLALTAAAAEMTSLAPFEAENNSELPSYRGIAIFRFLYLLLFSVVCISVSIFAKSMAVYRLDELQFLFFSYRADFQSLFFLFQHLVQLLLFLLPLFFMFGVLPPLDQFFHYLFEQVHIHLFGGSAMFSLRHSIYHVLVDVLMAALFSVPLRFAYSPTSISSGVLSRLWILCVVVYSFMAAQLPSGVGFLGACMPEPDKDDALMPISRNKARLLIILGYVVIILGLSPSILDQYRAFLFGATMVLAIAVGATAELNKLEPFSLPVRLPNPTWKAVYQYNVIDIDQAKTKAPLSYLQQIHVACRALLILLFHPLMVASHLEDLLDYLRTFAQVFDHSFGFYLATSIVVCVVLMKVIREPFQNPSHVWFFTCFYFGIVHFDFDEFFLLPDLHIRPMPFLLIYFMTIFICSRLLDLIDRFSYIVAHISLDRFSTISIFFLANLPCAFAFTLFSVLVGIPQNFVSGSVFSCIPSTMRPLSFWRDIDNTHDDTQRIPMGAFESIEAKEIAESAVTSFVYDSFNRYLKRKVAKDVFVGKYGSVRLGETLILINNEYTLVVIIQEIGLGYIRYQTRGLELVGTLCHDRERQALMESMYQLSSRFSSDFEPQCTWMRYSLGIAGVWAYARCFEPVNPCVIVTGANPDTIEIGPLLDQAAEFSDLVLWACERAALLLPLMVTGSHLPQLPFGYCGLRTLAEELRSAVCIPPSASDDQAADMLLDSKFCTLPTIHEDFLTLFPAYSFEDFFGFANSYLKHCASSEAPSESTQLFSRLDLACLYAVMCSVRSHLASCITQPRSFLPGSLVSALFSLEACEESEFLESPVLKQLSMLACRYSMIILRDSFIQIISVSSTPKDVVSYMYHCSESTYVDLLSSPNVRLVNGDGVPTGLFQRFDRLSLLHSGCLITIQEAHTDMQVIRANPSAFTCMWASQVYELIYLRFAGNMALRERQSVQANPNILSNLAASSANSPCGYPIVVLTSTDSLF